PRNCVTTCSEKRWIFQHKTPNEPSIPCRANRPFHAGQTVRSMQDKPSVPCRTNRPFYAGQTVRSMQDKPSVPCRRSLRLLYRFRDPENLQDPFFIAIEISLSSFLILSNYIFYESRSHRQTT